MRTVRYSGGAMTLNDFEFNRVFNSWNGPVGRDLAKRAERVAALARTSAGHRTGALRSSIGVDYNMPKPGFLSVDVYASVPYAAMHHDGTRPHIIVPRHAPALRFRDRGGRLVVTQLVRHPGFRGNPFLTEHIREVM